MAKTGFFQKNGSTATTENDVQTQVDAAEASATAAAASATSASTSATNAANSVSSIGSSVTSASNSAAASATSASNSAAASATSASNSSASASSSETAKVASEASQAAAETAETNSETAKVASEAAQSAAETAQAAAETAEANAESSALNSASSSSSASTSASTATTKAAEASASAVNASNSAAAASTSETNSAASATSASGSAATSTTKASEASTSAANAASSASQASSSSAAAAASSTSSASSAGSASSSATSAANSASSSSDAQTASETAQAAAETAEANASNSASSASTSAANAASSASSASASAATSTTKASQASTSASNAANSASSASAAQTAAESARDSTLSAFDSFDDRYLGAKTSDPSTDNDGNTLVAGTLYFNSTSGAMKLYTGSAWVAAYVSGDGFAALTGATFTGNVTVPNLVTSGNVDGRDVSVDGSKLDGIESGATADQSASEILTAVKTVDGASSGLDSDLLDGQHGSYYLNYNNFTNTPTLSTTVTALTDTTITSVGDNELLAYDSSSSKWINQTPAEAGFATVATSNAYSDLSGKPTIPTAVSELSNDSGFTSNLGDITAVTAGSGLSGGGTSGTVTLNHEDTSTQASVNNSGRTYIQDVTLDTYGHVTGLVSATETVTDTVPNNATITLAAGTNLSGGGNFTTDQSSNETITFNFSGTIPTATSDLTNDSGFITSADGGNAQTLDSLDSTQFLRSDAADTKTSGDLTFSDNVKAIFGTDTDAELYFDNANSDLILNMATDSDFMLMHGTEKMIVANNNSTVELYTNGIVKMNTSNTGVSVFGYLSLITDSGDRIIFEGTTADSADTTLVVIDPSENRTITLPDASGTVLLDTGNQTFTGDLTVDGQLIPTSIKLHGTSLANVGDFTAFSYRYVRIRNLNGHASGPAIQDLRFNTASDGSGTDYPSDMTSNSAPSPYVASASWELNSSYAAWKAFDNSTSTMWWTLGASTKPAQTLTIDLGSSFSATINHVSVKFHPTYFASSFILEGSNTGSFSGEEVEILNITGLSTSSTPFTYATATGTTFASIEFEGGTEDAHETRLVVIEPTADRTITLPDASGTVLLADGDGSSLTGISAGTNWQSTVVTGTTLSAVAGNGYWIDTTSNECTITFPASASVGDTIELVDYARTWGTNKIIIDSNGLNYQGEDDTLDVAYDTSGQALRVVYSSATKGWIPTSDEVSEDSPTAYKNIDFLAVGGGGGGGGGYGAGGGAGGYRTSFGTGNISGRNSAVEDALSVTASTTLTITVGAGGSGTYGSNTAGGSSKIDIEDDLINSIEALGGGRGGSRSGGNPGGDGGSGGGSAGANTAGAGTASQGFDGGVGHSQSGAARGGGGGGATEVGDTATSSKSGDGGDGLASTITGSSVTRAGGGGGGAQSTSGTQGFGGAGGGGVGSETTGTPAAATVNTGGGGGGGGGLTGSGGNGGSGVVILRMLTADYSGTTTGSPTVSTSGSDTILTFNASGSYTV